MRFVGRSWRSLLRWRQEGVVRCVTRGGVRHYEASELLRARETTAKRVVCRDRSATADPGRVAELVDAGWSYPRIARELGCSVPAATRAAKRAEVATW